MMRGTMKSMISRFVSEYEMRTLESRRNRRYALDAEQSLAATQLRTVSVDVGALQYERKRSSIGKNSLFLEPATETSSWTVDADAIRRCQSLDPDLFNKEPGLELEGQTVSTNFHLDERVRWLPTIVCRTSSGDGFLVNLKSLLLAIITGPVLFFLVMFSEQCNANELEKQETTSKEVVVKYKHFVLFFV